MRALGRRRSAPNLVILLQLVVLLGWRFGGVLAGGGALDSGSLSSYVPPTGPTTGAAAAAAAATSSTAKVSSFSGSLTEGIAKAVAQEGREGRERK